MIFLIFFVFSSLVQIFSVIVFENLKNSYLKKSSNHRAQNLVHFNGFNLKSQFFLIKDGVFSISLRTKITNFNTQFRSVSFKRFRWYLLPRLLGKHGFPLSLKLLLVAITNHKHASTAINSGRLKIIYSFLFSHIQRIPIQSTGNDNH